ncbi:AraC family transcriptional regulator, partial [Mycobacterium gordonae]|nr:AraC family transcriptional regulator [Mycobacterium gordonae]
MGDFFLETRFFHIPVSVESLSDRIHHSLKGTGVSYPGILIVWSGKGILRINRSEYGIKRGSVFFLSSGSRFNVFPSPGLEGMLLHYQNLSAEDQSPLTEIFTPNSSLAHCPDKILTLAARFTREWKEPHSEPPFQLQQQFTTIMADLYEEMKNAPSPSDSWIKRSLAYIDTHFHEELTREQMARQAAVSPEHYSRSFRKATGRTFNSYIT